MKNFFLFVLCISLYSCKQEKNETKEEPFVPGKQLNTEVALMTISSTSFHKEIISNGLIEAEQKTDLFFKTSERISDIFFRNGENVKKGETIAKLDNELLKLDLREAAIHFNNAENMLIAEKIRFGKSDVKTEDIAPNILNTIYQNSGYLTAQNRLERATVLYNQTLLKAPFDGKIANLIAKPGNLASPSQFFCIIYSDNKLDVVFYIMESDIGAVKLNQEVTIVPFANDSKSYSGVITELNPLVNEQGLVRLKAHINSPDNILLDGMNVKVTVKSELENLTVIPKKALVFRSNQEVVFTAKNGFAQWNDVEIRAENSSQYGLKGGLKVGDTIIISGNLNLTHNSEIKGTFTPPNI